MLGNTNPGSHLCHRMAPFGDLFHRDGFHKNVANDNVSFRQNLPFRCLTILDVFTRECLAIEVGQRLSGTDVVTVLNRIRQGGRLPGTLFYDNGSEFTSQILDLWAYYNKVKIEFSRPGKPTDNAFIESFNGTFRDECLNAYWFESLKYAKMQIAVWRQEYKRVVLIGHSAKLHQLNSRASTG